MIAIIGLGNPGKKYEKTRHNVGFRVIDQLSFLDREKVVLAKPKGFMNNSGKAVKELLKNKKIKPRDLIVIHDDIDLPLGKIRIVKNRGSAGHKGVGSIIKEIGTKNFIRIRIGILPERKPKQADRFVLQNFKKEEEKIVKEVVGKTTEAIDIFLKEGLEKMMNRFNK